jgi:hypothetical protein
VNHKRGRPKSRRAGCLLCKPHKANGCKSKGHRREEQKLAREHSPVGTLNRDKLRNLWSRVNHTMPIRFVPIGLTSLAFAPS